LGPAGTGKSYKIKQIFKRLDELDKKYIKLAPTNKASRIIGGETLDKHCAKILKSDKSINKFKSLDYIFVDEVSMMRELFFKS
jgi:MoxR-like ATPase